MTIKCSEPYYYVREIISTEKEVRNITRKILENDKDFFNEYNKSMPQSQGQNPMSGPTPPPLPETVDSFSLDLSLDSLHI
jgi:hypothetical protein